MSTPANISILKMNGLGNDFIVIDARAGPVVARFALPALWLPMPGAGRRDAPPDRINAGRAFFRNIYRT